MPEISHPAELSISQQRRHELERSTLISMIDETVLHKLLGKEATRVSDADIEFYIAKTRESRSMKKLWVNRTLITIEHLLQNYQYDEKHRKRLTDARDQQHKMLEVIEYEERNDDLRKTEPGFKQRVDLITADLVKRKKQFRAIIDKYPSFSAYTADYLSRGNLVILDERFNDIPDLIKTTASGMDKIIPAFIEYPSFDPANYQKTIEWLKATPHRHPDMEKLW